MLLIRYLNLTILAFGLIYGIVPSAQAQWYVSGNGGLTALSTSDITHTEAGGSLSGDVDFDEGFGIAVAAGYSWGDFRLEGEVSYRQNNLDDLSVDTLALEATTISRALGTFDTKGDTSALGFMANAWYDYDTGTPWVPSIGGGLGVARVNIDIDSVAGTAIDFDKTDTVFAYQLGVGLGYNVTSNTTVGVSYRLFGTDDQKFDNGTAVLTGEHLSHNFMVGFVNRF